MYIHVCCPSESSGLTQNLMTSPEERRRDLELIHCVGGSRVKTLISYGIGPF